MKVFYLIVFAIYTIINFALPSKAWAKMGVGSSEITIMLVVFPIIIFIIFLIMRELNCWYWKINLRNEYLVEICSELEKIQVLLTGKVLERKRVDVKLPAHLESSAKKCVGCGDKIPVNAEECPFCGQEYSVEEVLKAINKIKKTTE